LKTKQSGLEMIYGHVSSSRNINKNFHCTLFEPEKKKKTFQEYPKQGSLAC